LAELILILSALSQPRRCGQAFLAQALSYDAARAGHTVRFLHAADFLRAMA